MSQGSAQLEAFVRTELQKGATEAELRNVLKKQGGWNDDDLNHVFAAVYAANPPVAAQQAPVSPQQASAPMPPQPNVDAPAPPASTAGRPASVPSGAPAPATTVDTPTPAASAPAQASQAAPQHVVPPIQTPTPNTQAWTPLYGTDGAGTSHVLNTTQQHTAPGAARAPLSHPSKLTKIIALLLTVVALTAAVAFAGYAVMQSDLFSGAPYSEQDFLRGILARIGDIDSATYGFSGKLAMETRNPDAEPFELEETSAMIVHKAKYARDVERVAAVKNILQALRMSLYDSSTFPQTLNSIGNEASLLLYEAPDVRDPNTDELYQYVRTEAGANFTLTVTFETSEAVAAIRGGWGYDDGATRIEGTTVTFTNDSSLWMFISDEPPQPLLVELGEMARMLPPELEATIGVEATSDVSGPDADGSFAFDSFLDLGDMSYRVAFDIRKVGEDFYFRIRNIPGFFLVMLGVEKGTWVHVSLEDMAAADGHDVLSLYATALPELEEEYKKNSTDFVEFGLALLRIAEEERLVQFKREPSRVEVDGRTLYQYDLTVEKQALITFIERMQEEAAKYESTQDNELVQDTGLLTYLQGDEFDQMFTYLKDNVSVIVYVDDDGYPGRFEYGMRLVPPDTAQQLADKQGRLTLAFTMDKINEPVRIEAPEEAVPLQQLMEDVKANLEYSKRTPLPDALGATANSFGAWMSATD